MVAMRMQLPQPAETAAAAYIAALGTLGLQQGMIAAGQTGTLWISHDRICVYREHRVKRPTWLELARRQRKKRTGGQPAHGTKD